MSYEFEFRVDNGFTWPTQLTHANKEISTKKFLVLKKSNFSNEIKPHPEGTVFLP